VTVATPQLVELAEANSLIKVGQTVTGTGISGSVSVSAIDGTTLTLSTQQNIVDNTVLSFGTQPIRTTVSTNNTSVTNERYELDLNEERHIIQYIPASYIGRVVREFINLVRD
jgi:hypothetical protein